jgi:tRNA-modifying protein YgfZ
MNPEWQNFLQRHGALLNNGVAEHFGDAHKELLAAAKGTILCDMGQFGTLKVSGEDAPGFLQNMMSSDVALVTPAQAQPSSFNTPKGRILATFLIWKEGGDYFIHVPKSLTESIRKKLSLYVLRAKVKIEDVSEARVSLGVAGEKAAEFVADHVTKEIPKGLLATTQVEAPVCCSVIGGINRYQINVRAEDAPTLWEKLSAFTTPVGAPVWDWLNIRGGIPVILPATQEQFVPQMANLDLIGAIGFKKGCYPGQEIVARMHYLGRLKQRMYLAHVDGDTPRAGDKLYSAESAEQSCGMVVNAASAPDGGYDLLAVVQIASVEAQPIRLGSQSGAKLAFMPLPYKVPTEETAS